MKKTITPKFLVNYLPFAGAEDDNENKGGGTEEIDTAKLVAELEEYKKSAQATARKNQELLDELKKSRESLKQYEGIDPEHVRNILSKFENDEDMKLIAAGKYDEVIKKRTEKVQAELGGKLKTLEEALESERASKKELEERIAKFQIDTNLGQLFLTEGGQKTALEDFNYRARKIWKLEGDELVPRNEKGEILNGKNGILTPAEWLENMRSEAPHLFVASVGSNSNGNRGNGPKVTAIDTKIEAARKAGNIEELRRLRSLKKSGKYE